MAVGVGVSRRRNVQTRATDGTHAGLHWRHALTPTATPRLPPCVVHGVCSVYASCCPQRGQRAVAHLFRISSFMDSPSVLLAGPGDREKEARVLRRVLTRASAWSMYSISTSAAPSVQSDTDTADSRLLPCSVAFCACCTKQYAVQWLDAVAFCACCTKQYAVQMQWVCCL